MRALIVGDGYLAMTIAEQLRLSGVSVERTPWRGRADLGRLLGAPVDQVVITPEALARVGESFVDHIDGARWVICSWAAGSALLRARPIEHLVLERGGTVLSLSAAFGRGGDDNVTRIARCLRRYRVLVGVGDDGRLVQPLHIDDLVAVIGCHLRRPVSGYFEIAGPEAVPVAELCQGIVEILGVRPIGRGIRARRPIDWRDHDAPVDTKPARAMFGWRPLELGIRIEQAVHEAIA